MAVVLLMGAGLMIQSLVHVLRVSPGYDPRQVARIEVVGVLYGQRAEPEKKGAEIMAMAERVSSGAITNSGP